MKSFIIFIVSMLLLSILLYVIDLYEFVKLPQIVISAPIWFGWSLAIWWDVRKKIK